MKRYVLIKEANYIGYWCCYFNFKIHILHAKVDGNNDYEIVDIMDANTETPVAIEHHSWSLLVS
jgi:hypothetical protein